MERQPHDTDLSDAEWERIHPLLPGPCPGGRPLAVPRRVIVNAILSVLRTGCAWRWLSMTCLAGPWSTGTSGRGAAEGWETSPSAGIIDSPSAKTTATRGRRHTFAAQKVKGRKWHLVVDTLGLPRKVAVPAANLQDRDGARQDRDRLQDDFPGLRVVWGNSGYQGTTLGDWVQA